MKVLFIQDLSIWQRMIIHPEPISNLKTLAITAVEALGDFTPVIELLKVNFWLENLILHLFAFQEYGLDELMTFIKNMGYLKELVLIDCRFRLEEPFIDFIAQHRSLRRFQFGIENRGDIMNQMIIQPILNRMIKNRIMERSYEENIEIIATTDNTYSASCLPEDSSRLRSVIQDHCVVTLIRNRGENGPMDPMMAAIKAMANA